MKTHAVIDDDLVIGSATGFGVGGPEIPAALAGAPLDRLRCIDGVISDVAARTTWHIDAAGRKRVASGAGRQPLTCAWNAALVNDAGSWRVQSAGEVMAPAIKAECQRRIYEAASPNSQMNMTAAASAGLMSDADLVAWTAALGWVSAMRTRCRELIAAADATYAADSHWPALPSGVAALVAKY